MKLDEDGNATIVLSGPMTLYESTEIREALQTALSASKNLRIDLETSGPWDLAGLQLLISARATGQKSGQAVTLINVPGVCREIAERSGLAVWLAEATESFH
ncbi:MAG: hypothetical protein NVSMB9_07740 [Isosphaeraceae bacterium]